MKVIVVDDSKSNCQTIALVLESRGFAVSIAYSIASFRELMSKEHPDGALIDIQLPDGDGKKLCKNLKENPATRNIQVILMTATSEKAETISLCCSDDFLANPFDIDDLVEIVRKVLRFKEHTD